MIRYLLCLLLILAPISLAYSKPRTSGNFSTSSRYYSSSGKLLMIERKYKDRSYFYGSNGKLIGEKVNNNRKKK